MELHSRLVDLRKSKQLSQEELAEKLYVSRQTISNWERGKTYPDINSLLLIATFFDVSLDNLIKGDVDIMKHQVDQSQFKKWLKATCLSFFTHSFIQPLGRFYQIDNFQILNTLSLLPVFYCLHKLYQLMKNHKLQTYSQIIDFVNNKEKSDFSWLREGKLVVIIIFILWFLIILGQFIGTLLFH
ncbi:MULTISPECIES: helix-turn-helix domain-containing protein [Streptococcus]|uniref:Helix-turn-helix domain-containing protein n=1 Tax=Streptococcus caledonicus TaxID=2614158 RepID=A0ABW0UF91_9STRE|nr:helix-turn-helix transcriptional regulator [Streptococcus sp. S784/96/1]